MARRRLTAIAGALGLLAWLATSGVTAQADTSPGPDLTYYSLLATYSWSSHDVCFSNGTYLSTNPCKIDQPGPGPRGRNIAVCVQSSSADQQCDITQTNDTHNNYALVIQRINQQGAGTSCPAPPIPPCQMATQRASIQQTDTSSGSNFAGVFETINQSLGQGSEDDPSQTDSQRLESLTQSSLSGSNFAAVGQVSQQSQIGGVLQDQTTTQFAGFTETGPGINQTTGALGRNAAVLGQVQKQDLQSAGATTQTQQTHQDGDITQNGGAAGKNFASGNQFQVQREQGSSTTHQNQFGDPKCCSDQPTGGEFDINQATVQFVSNNTAATAAFRDQTETIIGNCDSPGTTPTSTTGGCTIVQSATVNGNTLPGDPCRGQASCHQGIACFEGSCHITHPSSGLLLSGPRLLAARSAQRSVALLA